MANIIKDRLDYIEGDKSSGRWYVECIYKSEQSWLSYNVQKLWKWDNKEIKNIGTGILNNLVNTLSQKTKFVIKVNLKYLN